MSTIFFVHYSLPLNSTYCIYWLKRLVRICKNSRIIFDENGIRFFKKVNDKITIQRCWRFPFSMKMLMMLFLLNVSEIENINIYKDKIRFRIWENQMQIPKGKEYILIELKNKRKYAFMLENNQKFVNTINEIRNKYINE